MSFQLRARQKLDVKVKRQKCIAHNQKQEKFNYKKEHARCCNTIYMVSTPCKIVQNCTFHGHTGK